MNILSFYVYLCGGHCVKFKDFANIFVKKIMKMSEAISVSLSGPIYSLILYENTKAKIEQEGFLLGEVIEQETKAITDNDQEQVKITKIIKINSVVSCPSVHYFYNNVGKIDTKKLKDLLGDQFKQCVAWYRFKRYQCNLNFTLRQKLLHKQLQHLFNIPHDLFTCCIITSETSDTFSTHSYTQSFIRLTENGYEQLLITMMNLSSANNTYKSARKSSESFTKLCEDIKLDTNNTDGLVCINSIREGLHERVDEAINVIAEQEKEIHELENEIKELQKIKKINIADILDDEEEPDEIK